MPTYDVTVEGAEYEVDAPDENTAWAWAYMTHQQRPAPKKSTFLGEVKRGAKQLLSSTQTGIGAVTSPEEAAKAGVERAQKIGEEAGEGVSFAPVKEAYQREGILSALGEAASQVPRAVAQMAPAAGATMAGARIGAMAGSPFGPVGSLIGGALGAGAALYPSMAGANIERQAQEQLERGQPIDINRPAAYGAAVGQTALEAAGTGAILGKRLVKGVLGIADDAALASAKAKEALVKEANRSLLGATGRGALRGATEMPVEVAQSVLERAQAGLDVTSPEALAEYGESAYQGFIGGAGLGAITGVPERASARAELAKIEVPKERQEAQRRLLAAREGPKGYEGDQALLLPKARKDEFPAVELPTDLAAIEQEFTQLQQAEQTPETQARMAALARQYETVAAKQPEAPAAIPPEQLGLGLEQARDYGDLVKERLRLEQQKQTPEVKARIKELKGLEGADTRALIQANRQARAQQTRDEQRAAKSAFSQPEVRETTEGQGLLFSQFELPPSRVQPVPLLSAREITPVAPSTMEKYGQRRLGLRGGEEGKGLYKEVLPAEAPAAPAAPVAEAPLPSVTEPVPEPKLAPKYPAELQPVMDKLTAAGVRPETQAWAENARNRPFLRKLMDMAPEAAPQARKALKLQEGSPKAEVFDALFPAPRVPAFEPAVRADQPGVGIPSKPRIVEAAKPAAPRVTEPVRAGVVPAERAAPAAAKPEGGAKPALEPVSVDTSKYRDTRGGKDRFHGTGKEITTLSSQYALTGDDRNYYGQGFYTTDALDISQGYAKKGGKDARIYEVSHKPVKLLNMEAPLDPEIEQIVQRAMGDAYPTENYETQKPLTNLREIYDEFRAQSRDYGLSRNDVQDVFDDIRYQLEQKGYRGFEHLGGLRTGKKPHSVKIFWEPEADVSIKPADLSKYEKAAEPAPKKVSLKEAEAAWEENNVEGAGTRLAFKDLAPERKQIWKESVEDNTATIAEYERLARDQAIEANAEARKAAADKARVAEEIRAREQAKREAAEAKRAEQERVKAEKEAEAKRKAEAAAERERAKREAVKSDDLWNTFNKAPGGRFLPFKKLTKGRQREWEAAVAAGTADMDTYQQIAGAQLDAEQARAKAKLDAILESSVATSKRRMAEAAAFEAEREAEAKRKAEEAEAKQKGIFGESPKHPEWATRFESDVGGKVVYSDSEGALLRGFSALTGQYVYTPIETDGRYRLDVDSKLLEEKIPAELLARLRDAKAQLVKEDAAKLSKYPDGPFTGVKGNVASSDGVDARYTDYLRSLMQDLGLGDIRVFMLHPEDLRTADAADKYKLYADWASARSAGLDSGEDGSVRVYGPDRKSFYISLRPGMSEQRTLETIAHELGHLIQRVAYDTAPSNVQKEIRAEYEQWLTQNKGKTARELIQALRNRETAAAHVESVSDTVMASELTSYWTSFSEWFADNVSKWATTDERPVSVVEKFFKAVADKLRALVAAVTGRDFAPAKAVAAFLNKMGPANPISWAGTTDTTAQQSRAPSPTEGIAETSELMKDQPGEVKKIAKEMIRIMAEKDDVSRVTRFRTLAADSAASVINRTNILYDGRLRDEITKTVNPEALIRQAQAPEPLVAAYFKTGSFKKDEVAGQWVVPDEIGPGGAPEELVTKVAEWGKANGMEFKLAWAEASKMIEARRLSELIKANEENGKKIFPIHKLSNKDDRSAEEQVAIALRGLAANPEIQDVADRMDKQRLARIDDMVAVGRITKEQGAEYKEAVGYVPFDRIEDFFSKYKSRRVAGKGLAQYGSLPEFVGSTSREVENVIGNHMKLMSWMISQTIKQDANFTTLSLLTDIGQARRLGREYTNAKDSGNVVEAYDRGHRVYFEVPTYWDTLAFKSAPEIKSSVLKMFQSVSNILRKIVTVMPPFVAKQVTDDIQRAFLTSGVEEPYKLVLPAITNFLRIAGHELVFGKSHPITTEFAKKGLVGDIDYNASNPAETILFNMGYSKRNWLSALHHRLESVTRASDLAIRKAIYDRTLVETKSEAMKEGDMGLAMVRAREFINFRRRGASSTVSMAIATVPFFNAYLQSTDLLLRSATGRGSASVDRATAKRMFWLQASKMLGFSLIYALVSSGDEEYEDLTLDGRADSWVIDGKELPVPGDLAALFKVPVEALVHYMSRLGTPEEQLASEAVKQTLGYAYEQFVGRVTPIPQAIRPVAEALVNHSFVTGRKLVGTYQEGMPAPLQTVSSTSELAKAIAKFAFDSMGIELSPIKIDNILRGYFGGAVPLLNMLVDQMINPNKTDRPLSQYWFLSQYLTPEVPQGPKEEFYDLANKVMPVKRALDRLSKEDMAAAMKYAKENEDKLKMAELVNIGLTDLRQTREYIKFLESVEGAKSIPDSAERLKKKQQVQEYENKMLDWVRKAKTQIFLNSKN